MADIEDIIRLGIEAARSGDKAEARKHFQVATREDPTNPQSWLWLAGVTDDPAEKQAVLQKAYDLDPTNELARKGLQALGVTPKQSAPAAPAAAAPISPFSFDDDDDFGLSAASAQSRTSEPPAPPPSASSNRKAARAAAYSDVGNDDLDFADSLDSLSSFASTSSGSRGSSSSSASSGGSGGYSVPDFGDDDDDMDLSSYMNRPRVRPEDVELTEEDMAPKKKPGDDKKSGKGLLASPLVRNGLLAAVVLIVIYFLYSVLFGGGGSGNGTTVAGNKTTTPGAGTAGTPGGGRGVDPAQTPGGEQPTVDPNAFPTPVANQPTPLPNQPPQPTTPPNLAALAQFNPAPVAVGTSLTAGQWSYNFVSSTYAKPLDPKDVGGMTLDNGRWILVLMVVNNGTGTDQPLPPDFFVLRDAQGRVYMPVVDASEQYLNVYVRGIAADISHKEAAPAGVDVSVPVIFGAAVGATDLKLFAKDNPAQGYVVLPVVP